MTTRNTSAIGNFFSRAFSQTQTAVPTKASSTPIAKSLATCYKSFVKLAQPYCKRIQEVAAVLPQAVLVASCATGVGVLPASLLFSGRVAVAFTPLLKAVRQKGCSKQVVQEAMKEVFLDLKKLGLSTVPMLVGFKATLLAMKYLSSPEQVEFELLTAMSAGLMFYLQHAAPKGK